MSYHMFCTVSCRINLNPGDTKLTSEKVCSAVVKIKTAMVTPWKSNVESRISLYLENPASNQKNYLWFESKACWNTLIIIFAQITQLIIKQIILNVLIFDFSEVENLSIAIEKSFKQMREIFLNLMVQMH